MEQRIVTSEQQKWVAKLVRYEYEIRYKLGRENNAADALSRVARSPCLEALYVSHTSLWDDKKKEALHNPYMQRIGKQAIHGPGQPYSWHNGLLCYKIEWWCLLNLLSFTSF